MIQNNTQSEDSKIAEYAVTNDTYMHYDNFSWQVGSILFAGVFAFWGFVASGAKGHAIVSLMIGQMLVIAMMSVWILYSSHNRQIYLCKIHRMVQLEKQLGMRNHVMWQASESYYKTYGASGHFLNYCIYWLSGVGTCAVVGSKANSWGEIFFSAPHNGFTIISIGLMIFTQLGLLDNERKLKKHLVSLVQ